MKKVIISLILGLSIINSAYAENITVNPFKQIATMTNIKFVAFTSQLSTTKVKTDEGEYRIFVMQNANGVSVTAVKIENNKK